MPLENPKIYLGLHMCEGVAEYEDERLFLTNDTLIKMNSSFSGKPVYLGHQEVDMDKLKEEADGYVVESFFNKLDGKHWVKFIVTTDEGHNAIRNGWRLSNSYIIKDTGIGGKWHNVDYQSEVLQAEYNHLAIVEKPRYEESIILTAEQFKEYNQEKEDNLKKLNSKEKKPMALLNIFKKNKVDNAEEIGKMTVVLNKSKREITINELMEEVDKKESECDEGEEKKFRFGEEDLTIQEIEEKYNALKNEFEEYKKENKKNEDEEEKKEENEEEEKKEENEEEKEEDKEKMNEIRNAAEKVLNENQTIETSIHKVARGKKLYGASI